MSMLPDDQLRAMVREAIARHAGDRMDVTSPGGGPSASPMLECRHASHLLLPVAPGSAGEGACIIEPSVSCNHCGYCQSYGH
jgi:hypothetical protein